MAPSVFDFLVTAAKIIFLVFLVIMPMVAYSVYAERRQSAISQDRVGPNRTGLPLTLFGARQDFHLWGLFQPLADGLKFFLKEDFTPGHVNKFYFWLAPVCAMVPSLLTSAVLPFGSDITFTWDGETKVIPLCIANLNVGPLFVFAISSLAVYGIVLAGWASNSKYPFFGGVRSTSQMISYELPLGTAIVPVLMIMGNLNLMQVSQLQADHGWNVFPLHLSGGMQWQNWLYALPMLISFVVFTISMFAETNRLPFDLPECETELVGGYHTEYSSMKFALFFMGEYAAMVVGSGITVTLFLGGWSLGFGLDKFIKDWGILKGLIHMGAFFAKVVLFILFFIQIRWALPRFRYDQLMKIGWVYLFEIALGNVVLTAIIMVIVHRMGGS